MAWNSFGSANSGFQIGINNAPINNPQFYLPLEPPEARPEPLSTVPFPRDPDFVIHDALLDQIHEKASIPGSIIVLVGLGGVGKTRLAIEYCHRVREQSADTWVFWIHASNTARCEKSLRDLADRIKVPGRQDRNANIFQLVGNWLQNEKIGTWVLVLDNVDDDELLHKPSATGTETQADEYSNASTQPPLRYLLESSFESSNGTIIITSRSKGLALTIVGHQKNLIDVQPLDMTEALVLLQNKLDIHTESVDMVELVEELEFMPLAIVQAASYIIHRSPRCSVSQYLKKLRKSDRQATKLLNYEACHIHRDWEAKNSILLTWQISFEHIRRIRQSAADLLSLMSFFDRQGIPENLLRVQDTERNRNGSSSRDEVTIRSSEEDTDSSSESDLDHDFEDDITVLRDYSFIHTGEDSTTFNMHRLVQLTARGWLRTQGQIERWKEQFISNLCREFPTGEYENWEKCRQLFPHVKSAILQEPASQDSQRDWATLLYRGAWYAWRMGDTSGTRELASKSGEKRVAIFGADSEDSLDSKAMLARAYILEGDWDKAEKLEVQVLEARKTKLGEDHPATLRSKANLASTYWNQARWEEAEQLQVQVMKARKTKLGEDHLDTLRSMGNLASIYRDQGRWEMAETLELQVAKVRNTKLGEGHPDTLRSMGNLASTYRNQGRWEEAEQLDLQVIEASKTNLGEGHPDTLKSTANLASTYRNQGRWEKAEQLDLQVMEASKAKLGEAHPNTLASMGNLASTYWNQGRWKEAEQLQVQVMKTRKTKLSEDHPDTLRSIANLASTYWHQGRWEEAEQLEVQVMEASKIKLGDYHPNTLKSMGNLASTYRDQGRWEKAEKLDLQVMEASKTKLGEGHADTLMSMANLASTYWHQGRLEEAERLEVQVMETSKVKLGDYHPNTLRSMANLAFTWKSSGKTEDAIDLLRECVAKQKQVLGPNHPQALSNFEILLNWETK